MTELIKNDEWYVWKPKSGNYKGRTVYISITNLDKEHNKYYGVYQAILGFYSTKTNTMKMHKGQITTYQFDHNCYKCDNQYMISLLEKKFDEYKPKWEEMRLLKDAKSMLLGVK